MPVRFVRVASASPGLLNSLRRGQYPERRCWVRRGRQEQAQRGVQHRPAPSLRLRGTCQLLEDYIFFGFGPARGGTPFTQRLATPRNGPLSTRDLRRSRNLCAAFPPSAVWTLPYSTSPAVVQASRAHKDENMRIRRRDRGANKEPAWARSSTRKWSWDTSSEVRERHSHGLDSIGATSTREESSPRDSPRLRLGSTSTRSVAGAKTVRDRRPPNKSGLRMVSAGGGAG